MATLNNRSVSAECEICGIEIYNYSIWLDVEDNIEYYTCDEFDCNNAFDGSNTYKFIGEAN